MEFLKANLINTTTQLAVNNNTSTIANLFARDPYFQYYTDGMNNDATTASITITFDAATVVSRIALVDTNLKSFTIFYNGSTANTFALTTTGSTIASSFSTNVDDGVYLRFSSLTVSSITIDMKTTQTANQEKRLGLMVVSDLYLSLSQLPSASNYKPIETPKQIVHTLSDGGTRIHNVRKKKDVTISLDYVSTTLRDSIKDIYELSSPFIFCPFGTTTSWDSFIFEGVWPGSFDFYEYSDNATVSGFSGKIKMKETPT